MHIIMSCEKHMARKYGHMMSLALVLYDSQSLAVSLKHAQVTYELLHVGAVEREMGEGGVRDLERERERERNSTQVTDRCFV